MQRQALLFRSIALGALLLGLVGAPLQAQRAHIGVHGGYSFDRDRGLIGAQLLIPIAPLVELYPSFDYYLGSGGNLLGFSGDLKFRVPTGAGSAAYFAGGANWVHASPAGGTDAGLDLVFGLESRRGASHPYVEGRVQQHAGSQVQIVAGLNFTLF